MMSFVTGLILVDAPASALNNAGSIKDELYGNKVAVKAIRAGRELYPYVSAQAFRYWLRETLENADLGWQAAPIYREEKIAYTDANPILYWDDDLFGYMRAPGDDATAKKARQQNPEFQKLTPLDTDNKGKELGITRVSPFRVSTFVSVAPVTIAEDWESMTRHKEGDSVPYSNQFYRTTLKGLFSLDLYSSGTFSYRNKTGFRNLDNVRVEMAKKVTDIAHLDASKEYRLPMSERILRIATLFEGLSRLEGGAKQTLHYTDVSPALLLLAVTKGGNHIFGHVVGANGRGQPQIKLDALEEALTVFSDEILSDVYVGWIKGYLDEERSRFEGALGEANQLAGKTIRLLHPRQALQAFVADLRKADNTHWLD